MLSARIRAAARCLNPFSLLGLMALLLLLALPSVAQTITHKTLSLDMKNLPSGVTQDSEGNFYTTSLFAGPYTALNYTCDDNANNTCDYIIKITPDGTQSVFHLFESDSNGYSPDGLGVNNLIEASDGNLYGSTVTGGSSNYGGVGTIFRIARDGTFKVLYTFPVDSKGNLPSGGNPGPIIQGSDGNFYGTTALGSNIFKITPSGAFTILYKFSGATNTPDGVLPLSLIEGADGNFYGTTSLSPTTQTGPTTIAPVVTGVGTLFSITPTGTLTTLHNFALDGSEGIQPQGPLTQGPDGNLYGTTAAYGYPFGRSVPYPQTKPSYGTVFKISPTGNFQVVYTFTGGTDGWPPAPALTVGSDGNFYGVTHYAGNSTGCPSVKGCGTVFQLQPGGNLQSYYSFLGGNDNGLPYGPLVQTNDGTFVGTTDGDFLAGGTMPGSVFTLAQTPALKGPIQITFAPTTVAVNQPVKLNWTVSNVFSNTMRQCHASIVGTPTGAGSWTGPQVGAVLGSTGFGGSATITPTAEGTYTYALNCGGRETGFGTLIVGNQLTVATTALPQATVAQPYSNAILATGGTPPYTWTLTSGSAPSGMSFDGTTGILSGTPDQFSDVKLGVKVTDNASTPNIATGTVTISIKSGLQVVSTTLPKAIVGTKYTQALVATGGKPPYSWSLLGGTLPDGIAFSSSGVFSGTPTKASGGSFTVQVKDSEGTPDAATGPVTLPITAPQLSILTTTLPPGLVGTNYSQVFNVSGGTAPFTWSLTGTLPKGLSLATGAGVISGTPLQFGSVGVGVTVVDSSTPQMTDSVSVNVTINSGLNITTTSLSEGKVGSNYAGSLSATGGVGPYKWSVSSGTLPAGLTLNADSGVISGTPATVGISSFSIQIVDSEGTPAAATSTFTVNITPAALVGTTTTLTSSATSTAVGAAVTFTATVVGNGSVPNGPVTFLNGSTVLGTGTLNASGVATFSTTFATAGVYSITASYPGNSSLTGSVSAPLTETVVSVSITAAITPGSLTIVSGSSGTLTITLTPTGGYTGTVSFSCGSLPSHVSCLFAPPSLTITSSTTSATDTLTINTAAVSSSAVLLPTYLGATAHVVAATLLWAPLSMMGLLGIHQRKRFRASSSRWLLLCILGLGLAGIVGLTGCAGNDLQRLAPGTYTVPINLSLSGGSTQTVNATVIVQ